MSQEHSIVVRLDIDDALADEVASELDRDLTDVETTEPDGQPWFDRDGLLMVPLRVVVREVAE